MKKVIRRELPFDKYKIAETFSTEEYCICENCGKAIKNIAIIEDSKGERFNVGLDCAATLAGITDFDILMAETKFNEAKRIRSKMNKAKKNNAFIFVQNHYWSKDIEVIAAKNECPECLGDYLVCEKVSLDFLKNYLPEYYKITKVNFDFKQVDKDEQIITEGDLQYTEYFFKYSYPVSIFGNKHCQVEMYDNNNNLLCSGSNGGSDFYAVNCEAIRLYNRYEFNKGLKNILI